MTEPGNARERDVRVQLSSALSVNAGTVTAAGVLQETGTRRQQIEQQSHAGPFAGPKPRIPSKLVMRVRFSSPARQRNP
jgi:hypothetical protein